MDRQWMLCGLQIIHPWMCDGMGHLTTRQYVAFFDDASYQLLSEVSGWSPGQPESGWKDRGWADVRQEIEYLRELRSGSLIRIDGSVRAVGRTSVTHVLEMREKGSHDVAARLESRTVFFDLAKREAIPISMEMRTRMQRFLPS